MTRTMALAAALGLALCAAAPADAQRVYKWTDENGVVHFSPTPPPEGDSEQVRLRRAPPAPAPAEEESTVSGDEELFAECRQLLMYRLLRSLSSTRRRAAARRRFDFGHSIGQVGLYGCVSGSVIRTFMGTPSRTICSVSAPLYWADWLATSS